LLNRLPWWMGGILMAGLLLLTFSIYGADRPIGASTYVPYFAGLIFRFRSEKYPISLREIEKAGSLGGS